MNEMLNKNKIGDNTSFTDIVDIVYLTPENSEFSVTKNGFLMLVSSEDVKPERILGQEENSDDSAPSIKPGEAPPHGPGPGGAKPPFEGNGKGHRGHGRKPPADIKYTADGRRDYGRVLLHRAFPFDKPDNIISVQQEDGFEIGIIRNIHDFDEKTVKILEDNLEKKYYVPEIIKIISAKDKFGFVYFKCDTDSGICEFVVRNPFGSIIRIDENHIFIIDIDGNRYSIKDLSKLDKKSYRKIELYV